jgi:hypothetical protein
VLIHFLRNRRRISIASRCRVRSRFTFLTNAMATGLFTGSPMYFAQTPDGQVFMANGIDAMLKWDGFAPQLTTVGVAAPTDAMTLRVSGIGTITGDYVAYERFLDAQGNPSNLSPVSNTITASSNAKVTYTGVPVPTESKVVRRQIVRNTAGQEAVFYVDIDTEDLGATTFTSTNTDDDLKTLDAVALFDQNGESIADVYGIPPNHKPYIAANNDRMFAAGHVVYSDGHLVLTNGSVTVTGVGTSWPVTFINRRLSVVGASEAYEVVDVNKSAQTLTLDKPWSGATTNFGVYSIAPFPAERRLIYFSEAGFPDAWSATNAIPLEDDGDEITGLMFMNSFLYVLERKHVYRYTFRQDPALDGNIYPAISRGCVNQRCYVAVEGMSYLMDRDGIYSFDGGNEATPISQPIQDLFRPESDVFRINWSAQAFFHAAHFPGQETVKFFVALSGERYPRHALCYSYRQQGWWIEEFPFQVPSSTLAYMDVQRTLLGGDRGNVFAAEVESLDGATPLRGNSTRGLVTAADPLSVSDSAASFATSGLVGSPIAIVDGLGRGQQRTITAVASGRVSVWPPWLIQPSDSGDDQSTYQIGAIPWRWQSGWLRWVPEEQNNVRAVEFFFQPLTYGNVMFMGLLEDQKTEKTEFGHRYKSDAINVEKGDDEVRFDLTTDNGYALFRMDGGSELYQRVTNLVVLDINGFGGEETPIIYHVSTFGVTKGE